MHCFKEQRKKGLLKKRIDGNMSYLAVLKMLLTARELDIALGNHALRAQPTDYSQSAGCANSQNLM